MAFDREATLKQGEKFLRQGRLDAAIAEYAQVVTAHSQDWNTANLLGDLYVRAQQLDAALPHYHRIGEHLMQEGRDGKAAALYKKVLKLRPDDEPTQMLLAELAARQGKLTDAKAYLATVGERRRGRGDREGAADVALRLASLDPTDIPTRLAAARTLEEMGRPADAAGHFRSVYGDLQAQGQKAEALAALRDAVRLNPGDRPGRTILARTAVEAGDVLGAQPYLDRDTAGGDPVLLAALVEVELRTGQRDRARALMSELLSADPAIRHRLLTTAWALIDTDPEAAYLCIEAVVDTAVASACFDEAAQHLETFSERRPHHVPGLLRLVEVCVDGDLQARLSAAQARLADAYLETAQGSEARMVAEDLLAREPEEAAHVDRLRRALVMLEVADPERHIADCLASLPEFEPLDLDDTPGAAAAAAVPEMAAPASAVAVTPEPASAIAETEAAPEVAHVDPTPTPVATAAPEPAPMPDPAPVSLESPLVAAAAPATSIATEPPTPELAGWAVPTEFSTSADRTEPPVTRLPSSEPVIKLSALPADVEPVVRIPSPGAAPAAAAADLMSMISEAVTEESPVAVPGELFEDVDLTFLLGGDSEAEAGGLGEAAEVPLVRAGASPAAAAADQEEDEFAAQYVKLAHTYVDMGMDDEAISSLQTAVKSSAHRFQAASLLGRIYMRRGQTRQAVDWLSRAAETPAPTVQDGRALRYDLGVMLDGAGQPGRALSVFLELQADAGDYRDVPGRIDRLARVESGG